MFSKNKSRKSLIKAIENKDSNTIRQIVQEGIDLNFNYRNTTPLHSIAQFDLEEFQKLLDLFIKNGGDINAKNNEGETPLINLITKLDLKSEQKFLPNVKYFIESGADLNAIENRGLSPLYFSVILGMKAISDLLIRSGANVNIEANVGVRILEDVLRTDLNEELILELVNLLLTNGAEMKFYSPVKSYPLIYIAESTSTSKIFRHLIEQGADFNELDYRGGTLLMQTCYSDHYENAEFLIGKGIDIDYQIKDGEFKGMSALMTAAGSGSIKCTKLLLEKGANKELHEAIHNASAQKIARKTNHSEIEKLIRDYNPSPL